MIIIIVFVLIDVTGNNCLSRHEYLSVGKADQSTTRIAYIVYSKWRNLCR